MKRLVLAFALLFGTVASAQIFEFGVKGGVGFQTLDTKDFDGGTTWESLTSESGNLGWHVGLQSQINLIILKVKPELYYTRIHSKGTLKAAQGSGGTDVNYDYWLNRIDLPVLVGFGIGPISINVGPVWSAYQGNSADGVTIQTENIGFGYQAGLGLKLGKITFDARYEGAFHDAIDGFTVGGRTYNADQRPSQFLFSAGYMF